MTNGYGEAVRKTSLVAFAAAALFTAGPAAARDQLRVAGSSTVFPYSQAAAERFAHATGMKAPVVESTGTVGGFRVFCQGVGAAHPDVVGASRAMTRAEFESCAGNGVSDITEVPIGHDGLTVAVSLDGVAMALGKRQLFLALAAQVFQDGKVVANPYRSWSQIDPALPELPIRVYGPPPTSGTRDSWVALVMQPGCAEHLSGQALDLPTRRSVCAAIRRDGAYVEAGENDDLIVRRLLADPNTYGIFGFSFLHENRDRLAGLRIEGVGPAPETIADGSYPISRPLYLYVKNAHRQLIRGLDVFLAEYVGEAAAASGGYLTARGLVPLTDDQRRRAHEDAVSARPMNRPAGR